jgi:hypothetical protein
MWLKEKLLPVIKGTLQMHVCGFYSRYSTYYTINEIEVKISIEFIDQFLLQKPVYIIHDVRGVGHSVSTVASELEVMDRPLLTSSMEQRPS